MSRINNVVISQNLYCFVGGRPGLVRLSSSFIRISPTSLLFIFHKTCCFSSNSLGCDLSLQNNIPVLVLDYQKEMQSVCNNLNSTLVFLWTSQLVKHFNIWFSFLHEMDISDSKNNFDRNAFKDHLHFYISLREESDYFLVQRQELSQYLKQSQEQLS